VRRHFFLVVALALANFLDERFALFNGLRRAKRGAFLMKQEQNE